MKKLLFLISLCLLSQNFTIASERAGESAKNSAPVPLLSKNAVSDITQSSYNSNINLPAKTYYSTNLAVSNENNGILNNSDTSLKFPGLKIIEETPVLPMAQTVTQPAVPIPQKNTPQTAIKPAANKAVQVKQATPASAQKQAIQPVKNPAASPPIINVPHIQENIKHSNQQQEQKTQQPEMRISGPPVPKSKDEIKQEYVETAAEQQKYKFYDDEKLQNAVNPQPQEKNEKKLNLWAEYKDKKSDRPPVIVEDNLSKPGDSDAVRATITKVEFTPSRVFTDEELQKLASPLLSQSVTIADIQKVVNGITRCYVLGDYATSKAYLPPQDLSDGILKIGLFEGTVGKVTIKDNHWTKTGYIENRVAPKEGDLLKVSQLEQDVIKFNNNNTVKLKIGLSAGEEQGETDITLNAVDPFPFHFAFMTDNQGRQTIGTTRWGGMITADSLFGHRDKLSLGGYLGSGNRTGFADYNFPINRFGTRLGASVSAGNISVVNGPMRPFGIGGKSQVYTVYMTHPLIDKPDFNLSSYTASSLKQSTTDISGFKISDMGTFSVTQGLTAKKDTEKGIWYTGHYGSVGFKGFGGDEDFFKYEGNLTRLHDFGHGIIGQFRVSGQYSPQDRLPWLEQFQIGGLSTVRGYSEGLLLGKSGYFASAEVITPLPFIPKAIGSDKLGYIYPREMIKGAVFMDNGMVFPYKGGQPVDGADLLMSWGLGLRVNISRDLAARFYWGFGLNNKYDVDQKMGRFHFDITGAPDIGRVVSGRHIKPKQKKESL